MKHLHSIDLRRKAGAMGLACMVGCLSAVATESVLVAPTELATAVAVRDVRLEDGELTGVVVNNSPHRVEDLTLSVSYAWHWRDATDPGSNNPGWNSREPLYVSLEPGATARFEIDAERPLPVRADGRIEPQVAVVSFTQYDVKRGG